MENRTELLDRIGFDAGLERAAFERLDALDAGGCAERLTRLVSGLRLGLPTGDARLVVLLLLDLLQTVNARLHPRRAEGDARYQVERLRLIEAMDRCTSAEEARRRFGEMLGELLRSRSGNADGTHPLIQRAAAFIEQNYRSRVYLSAVAAALNVSPNYLSRLFRRETGVTLTTYIQRVRLGHARTMLADGGRRISEIAYLVGYQNYRDFYRNFVKYEGASPREMQRRMVCARRHSEVS